jgi:hypothetical protein
VTEREQTPLEIPDCLTRAARPEDGRIGHLFSALGGCAAGPLRPRSLLAGIPGSQRSLKL